MPGLYGIITVLIIAFIGQNAVAQDDGSPHKEHFVQVNGVKLQYLDWGGDGESMVLLTGYGSVPHAFDSFATRFTDRFHVLSFTRRGTRPSEMTPSGYDLVTLTSDLAAFLDLLGIQRVHLVAHSFGGTEMTQFATLHPERVMSLVYIDAALDFAAGDAILNGRFPLPQPQVGSPYSQALQWLRSYTPDFSRLKSPALAFYTTQVPVPIPGNATDDFRRQIDEFARTKWMPLVTQMAETFRAETKGDAIVMDDVSHYIFRDREDEVVRTMKNFYASTKR
jgi:pimeloyl-ACP methyl ester carboxylesterase